ncbi:hypothetical protein M011DRAFT_402674 [Sporormia fimetaria CBS 119925]|uniref:Arrestin-like N-terminal domain-containing protein n=1 Tax=Sporormia fimetaria CBS 119925 TaxID=1340428 RepID=A0A6A6VDS6_9PLEO|nr:hypothetical protein M011DRAFT_402674 [Sporormia fimetaria CBS 119925]
MSLKGTLRVDLGGDTSRPYHEGEQVKGRVTLVLEEEEKIVGFNLHFVGTCATKTTRPIYVAGNEADASHSNRPYAERIALFTREQKLLPACTLAAKKYSWDFVFTFPSHTEAHFSRWSHGTKYCRKPHSLPPTFSLATDSPGGQASVSYMIQAKLSLESSSLRLKVSQMLGYLPSAQNTPLEPRIRPRVLYAQALNPGLEEVTVTNRKTVVKSSRKRSNTTTGQKIVPTLYAPDKVAPGQDIALLLGLAGMNGGEAVRCTLDSLEVKMSTYTSARCGQSFSEPEDHVAKHVTCISKKNMNQELSYSTSTALTTNFRLVDNAECVPTFETYTIARRYEMTVVIGIKCEDELFTIKTTSPLVILPRRTPSDNLPLEEGEDDEPLPLYQPREPSKEFAPDYDSLYSLALSPSACSSVGTRSPSFMSGLSSPITVPTTPETELEQPVYPSQPQRAT